MTIYKFPTLVLLSLLTACSSSPTMSSGSPQSESAQSTSNNASTSATQELTLRFQARLQEQSATCGQTYQKVGSQKTDVELQDLRFYLSYIQLKNTQGEWVPLVLEQDQKWQYKEVALLDFEDKTGLCESGTPETRQIVTGQVPTGTYTAVKFQVGVPVGLNHQDVAVAPSPLSLSSMFWSWRAGYKFLRLDLKTDTALGHYQVHLGNTGCVGHGVEISSGVDMTLQHATGDEPPTTVPSYCSQPNRPQVELASFNPQQDTLILDVGALLEGSDLTQNHPDSATGCQSSPDDKDCTPIFHRLGLFFDNRPSPGQTVFKVKRAP